MRAAMTDGAMVIDGETANDDDNANADAPGCPVVSRLLVVVVVLLLAVAAARCCAARNGESMRWRRANGKCWQ